MPKLNISCARDLLQQFDFGKLFVEELGWSKPSSRRVASFEVGDVEFRRRQVAELAGVIVFEITSVDHKIPDKNTQAAIHKEISKNHFENVLIFLDQKRTQSLWYWVKRDKTKSYPRDHLFVKGQPGDLFLTKLSAMVIDISELDEEGNIAVTEVAERLKRALDIERVTKKFYTEYRNEHLEFVGLIEGIENDRDQRWYASVLLNRLMFIYFLQKKFFLDNGDDQYLQNKLAPAPASDEYWYYDKFLKTLFFEGFAKPPHHRSDEAKKLLGEIKYLNGGLFLPHRIEEENPNIRIPAKAFKNVLRLFGDYSWNLNDTPGGDDNEISPHVLGYIFEKYINDQKAAGAYYTRPEITEYLCEQTIYKLILERINTMLAVEIRGVANVTRRFATMADLLLGLDSFLCRQLLTEVLPGLSILDPACGSGAFLVAAMKTLVNIYSAVVGRIQFLNDRYLTHWLDEAQAQHKSLSYYIKKQIITNNLFGVDLMEEGAEIAKLRLFLALVSSAENVDQLEPLPNIDFNILTGNSLIGLMHVSDQEFDKRHAQGNLFRKPYSEILADTKRKIRNYRDNSAYSENLLNLRDEIQDIKNETTLTLNEILLAEFQTLGIRFEQATWDEKKNKEGKTEKRALKFDDIKALNPFHWGYEFDEIINLRGGFDVIITNPPWEIFKPQAKEFFAEHSELVTTNKMTIKEFEKEQSKLLKSPQIRSAWLEYQSRFPHLSQYFRNAPQYRNQIAIVNGKKAGTDINLYKLFLEECANLLREGGEGGIVVPSGIYTDLGTKQLREMLFTKCLITGLFGFENRKEIFENVDSRFKFVVLTFQKGSSTTSFPAAFMRHHVAELAQFPKEGALPISVELIRRLSPDSLSVMEFKSPIDLLIADKLARFPFLGEDIAGKWNVRLMRELDMGNDSDLFKSTAKPGDVALVQGNMIHQFNHEFAKAKYWINRKEGRKRILGKTRDAGQELPYQTFRLVHRRIARNTDQRTAIACVMPPNRFCADTAQTTRNVIETPYLFFLTAAFNSFVADWEARKRVTAHMDMHFVYKMRIPRLNDTDAGFVPIVERAAKLICTTPEFDDLAREVGLGDHTAGVKDEHERARLRAELDGMIAHLYGLTEDEFTYILSTFPLVPEPVKVAAQNAFRDVERGLIP